jgi:hypothetical protein
MYASVYDFILFSKPVNHEIALFKNILGNNMYVESRYLTS